MPVPSTMQRLLVSLGHQVKAASHDESALLTADQEDFDLVISDLGLTDRTGYDLMRTLRERTDMAYATITGREIYLGEYGTPEAEEKYKRLIAEWVSNNRVLPKEWAGHNPNEKTIKVVIGPGDQGEPVITLMFPEED